MKVGDLVSVGIDGAGDQCLGIVTEICLPRDHRNNMYLIAVFRNDNVQWYPGGTVEAINENR